MRQDFCMTENLDSNNPTTPQSGTPAPAPGAPESVVVPPKAPQTKKETIRISLPPKPAAPGRPSAPVTAAAAPAGAPAAAKPAAPSAPAVPAGTALKMSGTPGPQNPTASPKQRAAAGKAGSSAGGKVQMIDQVLAILVAVAAIACVVTSFMLNNLGNTPGY